MEDFGWKGEIEMDEKQNCQIALEDIEVKKFRDRETIEWVNSWLSQADCGGDRILLIGDSVTRELRGKLEYYINHWYKVDLFATSLAITDDLFWRYLQCFFCGDYKYKIIMINYGFHHGFSIKCSSNEGIFWTMYQKLICMCQQLCDRVIIMTGTSFMRAEHLEQIDTELEKEVSARNALVRKVSKDTGCELFDLHYVLKHSIGRNFRYTDRVHFEQKTYFYIAYKMLVQHGIVAENERKIVQSNVYRILGIKNDTDAIIYGKGYVANGVYFWLKYFCPGIRVVAWAVTDAGNVEKAMYGIPVYGIDQIEDKNSLLILAVSEQYQAEMQNTVKKLGFQKIRIIQDIEKIEFNYNEKNPPLYNF